MQRPARELALASAALIGVVLPADWLYLLLPQITHLQWIACILGGYGFRSCWRLPYPIVALASGIGMGIAVPFLVSHSHSASVALQLALAWVLIHSLRWVDGGEGNWGRQLRYAVSVG